MPFIDVTTAKQYFLFDLDGTIVDLEQLNFDSFSATVAEKLSKDLSYNDYLDLFAGSGSKLGFKHFFEKYDIKGEDVSSYVKHYRDMKREVLNTRFWEVVTVKPGVELFLQKLKKLGKKTALATSTAREFEDVVLEKAQLSQYFDVILTIDEVSNAKPSPDVFLKALEKLGGKRSQALIFEDSPAGIQAACNAGIDYIIIQNRGREDFGCEKAVAVVSDFLGL